MQDAKKIVTPVMVGLAAFMGVAAAMMVGAGIMNANAESATTSTTGSTSTTTTADNQSAAPSGPHTANGKTEEPLTGDTKTKAIAAAQASQPGATVVRAETDADGATYEVHMTKSDGTSVTVMMDGNFKVTGTEAGPGGHRG
jgi:uncharacterized membrane protein YkoI